MRKKLEGGNLLSLGSSCAAAELLQDCGALNLDFEEESPAGLMGGKACAPCTAGDKGAREQRAMDEEADGWRDL